MKIITKKNHWTSAPQGSHSFFYFISTVGFHKGSRICSFGHFSGEREWITPYPGVIRI